MAYDLIISGSARRHQLEVHLFRPQSATVGQAFTGWLWGMQAEYADGLYHGCTEGRELTRTISAGQIKLEMTTMTKVCLTSVSLRVEISRRHRASCVQACMRIQVQALFHFEHKLGMLTDCMLCKCEGSRRSLGGRLIYISHIWFAEEQAWPHPFTCVCKPACLGLSIQLKVPLRATQYGTVPQSRLAVPSSH